MRFISSTPIELSYRGSVLTPHTRPDRFSSSAITPHSPSEVVARSELSVLRGFVQFCPVVSNFVHEPSAAALSTPAIYRRVGGNVLNVKRVFLALEV
jgi:hypothetical protein